MVTGADNPNLVPVDVAEPTPDIPTPGWQTTEFWLTLIALIVGALMSSGAVQEGTTLYQALAFAAVVLTALGYQVSRTLVKTATAKANAEAKAAFHQAIAFRSARKITLE